MGKTHRAELQNVCSHKLVFTITERVLLVMLLHPPRLGHPQTTPQLFKCSPTNALIPDERYTSWDKLIKKVLTDFQRGLWFHLEHPQPQALWLKSLDPDLGSLPALRWKRFSPGTRATNACYRLNCSLFPPST